MTIPNSEVAARRIAAIDVGSNSIRQIIADVRADGSIDVVDEMKAHPRLGRGLEETGALNPESVDAAIDTLQRMATLAKQFGAHRVEAVATSAVRDAENAEFFLARVKQMTGLKLRVLKGDDEARLCFRSALAHFDLGEGRSVIADIGGGSLELALSAEGVVDRLVSLPLGVIRLTERFLQSHSAKRLRKLNGPVGAAGIHHHDLISPQHARHCRFDLGGFVKGKNVGGYLLHRMRG